MIKRRKIITKFFNLFGFKKYAENNEILNNITDKINELKSYRFYLTYILDNNLLDKQINENELPKQLIITPIKNRR